MNTDWERSARAWIRSMGTDGDWSRRHVVDPALLSRLEGRRFSRALDIGCGEGRLCRMLHQLRIPVVGIDPTEELISHARQLDPSGDYRLGRGESLDFGEADFDLVISCLSLVDIADYRTAIREMSRVLKPGGTLLIVNLTSFVTAGMDRGWVTDESGRRLYYPVDRYLDEFAVDVAWSDIEVVNWHRPLSAYFDVLLKCGLQLVAFDEPEPQSATSEELANYRRAPFFHIMEWCQASRK